MTGLTLVRPDPYCRFYIDMDLYKDVMGVVLLKSDDSLEATNAEAQEKFVKNCEFDKYPEGIRLRPISFILRSTVSPL